MRQALLLLSVAAMACRTAVPEDVVVQPPTQVLGPVTMTTDAVTYSRGATVSLRITNYTQDTLGFNPCTRTVERHESGSSWSVYPEEGRMCTMELWMLEPRSTRTATTELPAGLPTDAYRLTIVFSPQRPGGPMQGLRASTPPFAVR